MAALRKWKKSSHSTSPNGNCVEAAKVPGGIAVRDSKAPDRGMLRFGQEEFRSFLRSL